MTDKVITWIKENKRSLFLAIARNKWLVAGLVIAILNPVPSGIILGIVMLTEEKLNRIGRIVLAVSVILVVVTFLIFFLAPLRHR